MGATNWRYYTPYQADAEAALQQLRNEIFARGEYVNVYSSLEESVRQIASRTGQDVDSSEVQDIVQHSSRLQQAIDTGNTTGLSAADRAVTRRVRQAMDLAEMLGAALPPRNQPGHDQSSQDQRQTPGSIEELLEWSAECGTHSILDIEQVGRRPAFGVASPLSRSALRTLFRSAEPTRQQVEDRWPDVAEKLQPWQARYLTVFADGQAVEYAFIGCSGD